jgi:hypothetical protein
MFGRRQLKERKPLKIATLALASCDRETSESSPLSEEAIMSNRNDSAYFLERAAEELELSNTADDPRAAAAHAELAVRYAAFAKEFETEAPRLRLVVG